MNHHLWWTIKVQIFSISSCACSQCRAGHLWQLLPLLPHPWPPAGVEENPVPSAAPRESCGSAGASGHLPLHVPSSQKPLWHGSVAGRDVTASIVPHYSSGMVLYTLSQGTKLQLSSNPLLQPLYFSGFSRRIEPEGAWPARLPALVPRGTFPSPWPHPARDTTISARCKTVWWLQAAGDVLIPESRVHINQGELWNAGSTSGQLSESIGRERLSPSGPCRLASRQSHFYLQPRQWCFVSVCLRCAPGQSCGHSARTERGCQGSCPAQGWQAGAGSHGCTGTGSILPGLLQCSALPKHRHSEDGEFSSWLVGSCLRNTGFFSLYHSKAWLFQGC